MVRYTSTISYYLRWVCEIQFPPKLLLNINIRYERQVPYPFSFFPMVQPRGGGDQTSAQPRRGQEAKPSLWKILWTAARPHTLTASFSPVIVGRALCLNVLKDERELELFSSLFVRWILFCILIQLTCNTHNDYSDWVRGADDDKRVGQARATQKGWLSPFQVRFLATILAVLALIDGSLLIVDLQTRSSPTRTFVFAAIVTTSVFNAFAYTAGPWPLGYIGLGNASIAYAGLGDLFVFLYFGLVATMTLPFMYISCSSTINVSSIDLSYWLLDNLRYAVQVGALATNIIVVNNLRDRHTDAGANKRTMAVRMGAAFCRQEYVCMIILSYALVVWDCYVNNWHVVRLLPLLSIPLARREIKAVYEKDGAALNPHVGGAAKLQFLFCILLANSVGAT
jgi:1,4-dihydroxy-2-naphthoate polyprenyltransferase